MTDKTYEGWRNWETWNVMLWINNDYPLYTHFRTLKLLFRRFTPLTAERAVREALPHGTPDFGGDGPYAKVDWNEIAAALNEN